MDKSSRHHYIITLISLALCLFIYIDSYLIPTGLTVEKIEGLAEHRTGRRSQGIIYTMAVRNKLYDIPRNLYSALSVDEEVELEKSMLTGSIQRVRIFREEEIWVYDTGYVRVRFGRLAVPMIILGCLSIVVFFKKMHNKQGRANLAYAAFICSILLLLAHLDLDIF